MIALDGGGRGNQVGITQMGGEGAQWIGLAPFTDDRHFVQNLGDGTFHHSGSLAIRAAVAAGVRITYKLLYNDAVAMTGGQRAEGRLDVPALTRLLAVEGVRRIVVTTAEPETLPGRRARRRSPPCATATTSPRSSGSSPRLDGVTVLIHDDRCAAEERRLRKRGKLPDAGGQASWSTSASARAAATAARSPPACRCSRSRPSSAARPASTRRPATTT